VVVFLIVRVHVCVVYMRLCLLLLCSHSTPTVAGCQGRSDILEASHMRALQSLLPLSLHGHAWCLLYSSLQHGASMGTFYAKVKAPLPRAKVFDSFGALPNKRCLRVCLHA
jgi:hypothetical protein